MERRNWGGEKVGFVRGGWLVWRGGVFLGGGEVDDEAVTGREWGVLVWCCGMVG